MLCVPPSTDSIADATTKIPQDTRYQSFIVLYFFLDFVYKLNRPFDRISQMCVQLLTHNVDILLMHTTFDRQDPEYEPVDNWLTSVLSHPVELTDEFKRHYEIWLQQEVFQASIDWDQLVASHLI